MAWSASCGAGTRQRNADADWDRWPVADYLAENYRELHPCDAAIVDHHSAFYRRFAPNSFSRSLEFGAGPNLYPLMLAAAASCRIDALEPSAANVAYLNRQLVEGADDSWRPFYRRCQDNNASLPATLDQALSRVRVQHGSGLALPAGGYDSASMTFVAEGVTEDIEEFATFCRAFIHAVHPGGHLVAAFMENMARYRFGDGSEWPGCPIVCDDLHDEFEPFTERLTISRLDPDTTLPDYGYTGMLLLTACRTAA
jgi:hypothetical protein